jgi:hypothetical protein
MSDVDTLDWNVIVERLRNQVERDAIRITLHAHQEMVDEDISYDEIKEVLLDARIVENYPLRKRGACCLAYRATSKQRFIHMVCTTSQELIIVITAYEPKPPKWITAFERGR